MHAEVFILVMGLINLKRIITISTRQIDKILEECCMRILLITIFEISIYMYAATHHDISLYVGVPHYNIPFVFLDT
jgi:hypothetical protein